MNENDTPARRAVTRAVHRTAAGRSVYKNGSQPSRRFGRRNGNGNGNGNDNDNDNGNGASGRAARRETPSTPDARRNLQREGALQATLGIPP